MTKRQSNEETFAAKVAECKEEWEAGSYAALVEGFIWCAGNGLPLPEWMFEPILEQLNAGYLGKPVAKKGGRGKGHPVVEEETRAMHAIRWGVASRYLSWRPMLPRLGYWATREGAFEAAYDEIQKLPPRHPARGSRDQIEDSFNKVQAAIREGQGLRYGIRKAPP